MSKRIKDSMQEAREIVAKHGLYSLWGEHGGDEVAVDIATLLDQKDKVICDQANIIANQLKDLVVPLEKKVREKEERIRELEQIVIDFRGTATAEDAS